MVLGLFVGRVDNQVVDGRSGHLMPIFFFSLPVEQVRTIRKQQSYGP
jgi:hypothetical protein